MQIIYICFVSIWKHTQISTICAGFKFQWTKTKIIYPWHSKEEDLGLDNSSNNVSLIEDSNQPDTHIHCQWLDYWIYNHRQHTHAHVNSIRSTRSQPHLIHCLNTFRYFHKTPKIYIEKNIQFKESAIFIYPWALLKSSNKNQEIRKCGAVKGSYCHILTKNRHE